MYSFNNLHYTQVFSSDEVDTFCERYREAVYAPAVIRNRQNIDVSDPNKRKSDRIFIPFNEEDPFLSKLVSHIKQCNDDVFKFPGLRFNVPWELLRYQPGDFFGRHHDQINKEMGPFISAAVYLQDQNDFGGGRTLFYATSNTPETFSIDQRKGYVVVYPSPIYHEVTPVTVGMRLTLVSFFISNKYDRPIQTNNRVD